MAVIFQKVIQPGSLTLGAIGLTACTADHDYAASAPVSVIGGHPLPTQNQKTRPQLATAGAPTYTPFQAAAPPLHGIDPTQPIIVNATPIAQGNAIGLPQRPPAAPLQTTNYQQPVMVAAQQHRIIVPNRTYAYHQKPQTPILRGGYAIAPANVPAAIRRAIAAGNDMQTKPYRLGGGHSNLDHDNAYDCSGTTSYVLRKAGLMQGCTNSTGFMNYGLPGRGKFITIWAKPGHVFMEICGLRLDTGGSLKRTGPRWKPAPRSMRGFIPRHPPGM